MRRLLIAALCALAMTGCESQSPVRQIEVEVEDQDSRIFLVDRTGKKWDITHAVSRYGFDPARFEFGLGPYAITPFINPDFLSPGDPGYPPDDADFLVMGTVLHSEARAYKISDMSWHEVANDRFGNSHVAVAY